MFNKIQNCNCERKCFDRVPKDVQERIYKGYNYLPNNNEKNLYLYGLICKTSDKGDQPNSRASYRYFVKVNGFQVDICQKAFINIHGITPAKVRTLLQKLNEGVIYPNDRRGEARRLQSNEISEANEQEIANHIISVVRIEEVWDRIKRGEKINITRLWEDYKGYCGQSSDNYQDSQNEMRTEQNRSVSKSTYSIIFKRLYPEIINQLDEKNELPSSSKRKSDKSTSRKRKADAVETGDENLEIREGVSKKITELASQISESDAEEFAKNNDEESQSVSSSPVIYSFQPIQVVHMI
ncbi:uncharacterized protein LOC135832306 [Planococcus citri]|uniref:uncharacterized protein LOC135832306 n=1 Tax=Planococcus citri TaxID=170843 RepID=UPI0031F8F107